MKIEERVSGVEITEKTKLNIIRKSTFVDEVMLDKEGLPLPSWIDISVTELCNRVCEFCPRVDPDFYPNQNLNLSLELASKIVDELKSIDYSGGVVFCGYGEPMLHPRINLLASLFRGIHTEMVTNGDKLDAKVLYDLYNSGLSFVCVSMYDGPHQEEHFRKMFEQVGIHENRYILRDRWHKEVDSFGLKLTNRSGVLRFGPDPDIFKGKPCYYPSYSMAIDWNGDVLLCVQDWNKRRKFGNLSNNKLIDVWRSISMDKTRCKLIDGDRTASPCKGCNADGTMHGFNHVNAWTGRQDV